MAMITIGIDLAKNVFALHGVDEFGKPALVRPSVKRDILIDRLHKRIEDVGVIRLIRAYLNSGIMSDGVVQQRYQGDAARRAAIAVAGQRLAR